MARMYDAWRQASIHHNITTGAGRLQSNIESQLEGIGYSRAELRARQAAPGASYRGPSGGRAHTATAPAGYYPRAAGATGLGGALSAFSEVGAGVTPPSLGQAARGTAELAGLSPASSLGSRMVTGATAGALIGSRTGSWGATLLGGALGGLGGAGMGLASWSKRDFQRATIKARRMRKAAGRKVAGFGGRMLGAGLLGMVGNAVAGPAGGLLGLSAGLFPGTTAKAGAAAFRGASGLIGAAFRTGALGLSTGGAAARTIVGGAIGGMMAGLPGVGVGATIGAGGGFGIGGRGLLNFMGKHPNIATLGIGAMLSVPALIRGALGATRPSPEAMDMARGSNRAVYGMDANNFNTLGLTLALHYRR
jgi:hypothetical protein